MYGFDAQRVPICPNWHGSFVVLFGRSRLARHAHIFLEWAWVGTAN
jgi:hypothetical protein